MRRPVTLSDRARGYGLWPGDVLARLPGARFEDASYEHGPYEGVEGDGRGAGTLTVSLSLPADTSPVADVPVRVVLTFGDARVRAWRPSLRERLRRRPTRTPEVIELQRGRRGRYRLLHSAGRIVVTGSGMAVDVEAVAHLGIVRDTAAAS